MAVASNFPVIRPSLNLDFANARALDPRITFSRASAATYYDGKTVAKAEENLLLNSAILATQSVTTRAEPYTLSFIGTGTVTLSGTSTAGPLVGTGAANRVSLTFTPTAGTLTLTVNGAVEQAQLEARSVATAYTPTTTQPITNYIPALQTAPAGVPRFDHNPVTGESLGLLVEEQRTNFLTYSEQFDSVNWTKTTSSISISSVAPNGGICLALVPDKSSSPYHSVHKAVTGILQANNRYTFSVFAKYAGIRYVHLRDSASGLFQASFDLLSGTIASTPSPINVISRIDQVGNGWYRVSVSFDVGTSVPASTTAMICACTSPTVGTSFSGDDYSSIYIWGAQLEAGSFPTSYIKTEASQVTRAADSAQMLGTNFSSWYRQDEGTLFAEYVQGLSNDTQPVFAIDDGTINNRINLYADGTSGASISPGFYVSTSGGAQVASLHAVTASGNAYRFAGSYANNNFASALNASVVQDTSGVVPVVDRASIGRDGASILRSTNCRIKRIAYYPRRLTDAQLQALTA